MQISNSLTLIASLFAFKFECDFYLNLVLNKPPVSGNVCVCVFSAVNDCSVVLTVTYLSFSLLTVIQMRL